MSGVIKSVSAVKLSGSVAYTLVVQNDDPPPETTTYPAIEDWVRDMVMNNIGQPIIVTEDPPGSGTIVGVKVGT